MLNDIKKLREFERWFGKYILKNFGKKCPDFVWGCAVCRAYFVKELFDDFVNDLVETEIWFKKQDRKPKCIEKRKKRKQ